MKASAYAPLYGGGVTANATQSQRTQNGNKARMQIKSQTNTIAANNHGTVPIDYASSAAARYAGNNLYVIKNR